MSIGKEEIENRFGFHKGTIEGPNATAPKHAGLRMRFREFAERLDEDLPDGREKALAFTALQEASMWAHCGIAQGAPLVAEGLIRGMLGSETCHHCGHVNLAGKAETVAHRCTCPYTDAGCPDHQKGE